uniref:diguanylate cyclase n=1 Tax=Fundidesulfovibrio putealis TaxID=270496 RepID=A0A7C4EJ53_9BACT
MTTAPKSPRARKSARKNPPVWLLGLAGQPAKKIRLAVGDTAEVRRFEPRDLPSQADYDREDPLAVFVDLALWRALRADPPPWLGASRRVLVAAGEEPPAHDEVLAQGFLACLTPPLGKAKVTGALQAARESAGLFDDISRLLAEAQREREHLASENRRLAFLQNMLARAMTSLELPAVLDMVRHDLAQAFPVEEVLAAFWGDSAECELFLPGGVGAAGRSARAGYLLDLGERLRGAPAGAYRVHPLPGGDPAAPEQPGRALLVPLHHGETVFGGLSVLLSRDLDRQEQATARQALAQLAPWLRNALDYLRLKRRADRDGLTGLYNRRAFDARLDHELKRHMRHKDGFALLMADLDHFKRVNDTHGHLAGDAALRHAAQALASGLRSTDFLARYGGEEFVIILPHTGQAQAWMLAERLRRRVSARTLRYAGRAIDVRVSIGISVFAPGQAVTPAGLIAQADQALYAAKRAGRDRVSIAAPGRGQERHDNLTQAG